MRVKESSYHQLGKFIYVFQIVESQIDSLLILLSEADEEMASILISELEFSKKVKTVDVMLSRFVDVRRGIRSEVKTRFHKCMSSVIKLCERRNELVHSRYHDWRDVEGRAGLLRMNSKLSASQGIRKESAEELLPEAFTKDLAKAYLVSMELDKFRLQVIDWLYPDASA
jgi:hypothetical protein